MKLTEINNRDPPEVTPVWQPGQPKLLDRVRDRCRVRHLSLSTEHAYVEGIRRFILFHNKRHPLQMGAPEVSAFLTHLARVRQEHERALQEGYGSVELPYALARKYPHADRE